MSLALEETQQETDGEDPAVFEISFRTSLAGGDWWSDQRSVTELAADLPTALRQAAERPLSDWYPEEDDSIE